MVRYIMAALSIVAGLALSSAASAASDGFTTADVNMRAGPSTEYPRIIVLPRGAPVTVYGCVRGYTWCDVGYYHERGWVSSRYLSVFYDDRRVYVPYTPRVQVPIITFDFGYWDRWYPRYPWYRDYRWRRSYPDPDYWRERRRNDDVIIYPDDRRNDRRNDRRSDRFEDRNWRDRTVRPGAGNDERRPRLERPAERRDDRRQRRESQENRRGDDRVRPGARNDDASRRAGDCRVWRDGRCVSP